MSWDCLSAEVAVMFGEYSWRRDDYEAKVEQWAAMRRETVREAQRTYRKTHKPWMRPHNKASNRARKRRLRAEATPEQKAAEAQRVREWRAKNRDKVAAAGRRWREKNRAAEAERVRKWREANPEKWRESNLRARYRYLAKQKANSLTNNPAQGRGGMEW